VSDTLRNKTIRGVTWSFLDNISSSGVTFLVGLVLARILTPEEYGLLAMVVIFIAISNSIVDSGFSNALIRKIDANETDYNTVFYFNILIAFLLYFILYICAPLISSFFKEPLLVSITRVLSIVLVFNSLSIIQRTILVKKVDFKTQTKISLIASIVSGVLGILMAFCECGVWSLVGQQISRQLLNTFFLWYYSKWRPQIEFSVNSFKELFGFGSKLLISGLIDAVYKNIYYIVIGRSYHASLLGQYTRAEQFSFIFSGNLTSVIQRVSFPVLSSIQDDSERLREAYRKIIKTTMLITFACMLGLAAVAKPLILILIGGKWFLAVSFLQIVCLGEMLYPLHAINLNILQVKGRSDIFLRLEILKKTIIVLPIVLGIVYGIYYLLWGSVCISLISFFLNSYHSSRLVGYSTKDQIKDILPSFIVSSIVAIIMWTITLLNISLYATLIFQLVVGMIMAILIYEKVNLKEYQEVKRMFLSLIEKK
jgi:O-antigen/teichoic acid export membrane protein